MSAGTGGLGAVSTSGSDLDVQGGDAEFLASLGNVLSCQHGGVGRGLVTIGLDFHASGHSRDGFAATGITQTVSLVCVLIVLDLDFSGEESERTSSPAIDESAGLTYERSVTWTKVSLKDAKMRATPKTSSPVLRVSLIFFLCTFLPVKLTLSDLRTKRDVLGGSAFDLLLGRHCDGCLKCQEWPMD